VKGFRPLTRGPVTVYDLAGRVFYSFPVKGSFNLPPGHYLLPDNLLLRTVAPVAYNLPKLPRKERDISPKEINVEFGNVPERAVVNVHTGHVVIDTAFFASLPEYTRKFIALHEVGHTLYNSEWKCDVYAARKMLRMGYNPSQVAKAVINTLKITDADPERMRRNKVRLKKIVLFNYFR
jgi:hypothetical protein